MKNRDFRGAPAYPCAESRRIIKRQTLSSQTSADSGENIAHSAGGHSWIAGRVIAQRAIPFSHDRPAAFQQKRHRKTMAEFRCRFGARLFLSGESRFISPGCGVSKRSPLQRLSV